MHPYLHIGSISLPAYGVFCALGIVVSCVMTLFRARRFGIRADMEQEALLAECRARSTKERVETK